MKKDMREESLTALESDKTDPASFAPMFFSIDAIVDKSINVLEINSGYLSGFFDEKETYITYLQTCRRSDPVILVCNDEKNKPTDAQSDYENMISLAKIVLTETEQQQIYFIPYKFNIQKILDWYDQKLLEIKAQYPAHLLALQTVKIDSKFKKKYDDARKHVSYKIVDLIEEFQNSKLNEIWPGRTPTIVLVHPNRISPTQIKMLLQEREIPYPLDSASSVFAMQCYDKALQRVSQKKLMAPAELLDIYDLCTKLLFFKIKINGAEQLKTAHKLLERNLHYGKIEYKESEKIKKQLKLWDAALRETAQSKIIIEQEMKECFQSIAKTILIKLAEQEKSHPQENKDFPKQVVLKPTSGQQGQGIIICQAEASHLGEILFQLAECSLTTLQENKLIVSAAEAAQSLSEPAEGGLINNIKAKLQELVSKTLENTGFFLIEEWASSEPVIVPGGKKLATWRFIVETQNQQFTVKPMKLKTNFIEQERRIYGKLPPLKLTNKSLPSSGECVSYIPEHDLKKGGQDEERFFLPDQSLEEKLLAMFKEIQQPLEKSLQATLYEYLEILHQSPEEYQQHFLRLTPSLGGLGIIFSYQDRQDIRRFLEEKDRTPVLKEALMKILVDCWPSEISPSLSSASVKMPAPFQDLIKLETIIHHLKFKLKQNDIAEESDDDSEAEEKDKECAEEVSNYQTDSYNIDLEAVKFILLNFKRKSDPTECKYSPGVDTPPSIPYPHHLSFFRTSTGINTTEKVLQALHRIENRYGTYVAMKEAYQFCLWAKNKFPTLGTSQIEKFIDSHKMK